jgi:hypothetical protein
VSQSTTAGGGALTPTSEPRYDVVWPLGRSATVNVPLNPRLPVPDGKKIGFVWDYVFRGDEMFELIAAELKHRFPTLEFIAYPQFGNIHGSDEREVIARLPDRLREEGVDAVIIGVGA